MVEEEAICGIPHMDKIVINEEVILKKLLILNINKSAGVQTRFILEFYMN